jgi:hypothetical protein
MPEMKLSPPLCAMMLIASPAIATTYYVSGSGSDLSDGLTMGTAWLTLQHASDNVVAGDSVIVLPSTYAGFYHTTSGTAGYPIVFSAQAGVVINAPNATTDDGINLEGASYVVIEGFSIYGMPRTGIRSVLNHHVTIQGNFADSCFKWGILTGFSDDILIQDNTCSRSVDEHGIYFSNSADRPIIRGNHCWGNNANGIHMNGDASLGGDGIISEALVEGNVIHDNGQAGGSAINCDAVQNSVIRNNLAYNNHASGISLYRIDGGGGSSGNVIVNNTIVQASDGRWALNVRDGSVDNIAFNNIFLTAHPFRGCIAVDAASLSGFHSDFNVLGDRMSADGDQTVISLDQWRALTQSDSNSVLAWQQVVFVDSALNDYHLLSTSPARSLGVASYYSQAAPTTDLDEAVRPQGSGHDAGAYEFSEGLWIRETTSRLAWSDIPDSEPIRLYDLSGRLIGVSTKKSCQSVMTPGMLYLVVAERTTFITIKQD